MGLFLFFLPYILGNPKGINNIKCNLLIFRNIYYFNKKNWDIFLIEYNIAYDLWYTNILDKYVCISLQLSDGRPFEYRRGCKNPGNLHRWSNYAYPPWTPQSKKGK